MTQEIDLSGEGILRLLSPDAYPEEIERLHREARKITDLNFGRKVYIRGLIEVTNVCRNNCLYCGIRKGVDSVKRYTLTPQQILDCCRFGYRAGIRTFVMQGGENPALKIETIAQNIRNIKEECPEVAITLSLGELSDDDYQTLRDAGADRYLLRHEAVSQDLYSRLHPSEMSLDNRLRSLYTLKELGYQTGTGFMVGAPYQTIENILEDIQFMQKLQPEMIGIGPFIPASGTPFENFPAGSVELTQRLVSIFRILFPHANIPATTAVATLAGVEGRIATLEAGANVVMPNISPTDIRASYRLYDNKAATGLESFDAIEDLRRSFAKAGFELSLERGDFSRG